MILSSRHIQHDPAARPQAAAFLRCRLLAGAVLLWTASAFCAGQGASLPQLTYTKLMKGSVPSYEKIAVRSDGAGSYASRSPSGPSRPLSFHLTRGVTEKLFALAAKLHDFEGVQIESHKRVADLGLKTFRYEGEGHVSQVQFNYSLNRPAQDLTDMFESIGAVERHILALEYSMRYDPLGLPKQLDLIQVDLDNKALLDPELLTPTLRRITRNPRYLHLAQARAHDIIQQIQDKK